MNLMGNLERLYSSLPPDSIRRQYAIEILRRYWGTNEELIRLLPIPCANKFPDDSPPRMNMVLMPAWAKDCGVEGGILVPCEWNCSWDCVPWFDVVWWMANGWPERIWEEKNGCIHSYSINLKGWDSRLWEYAWINRIAMFLRRWAAFKANQPEHTIFGAFPSGELILTHDVDAIRKTGVIRLKQAAFNIFNFVRLSISGQPGMAVQKLSAALRFLLSSDDYLGIPIILDLEKKYGLRSVFLFYAGGAGWRRSIKSILIDPSYEINAVELGPILQEMLNGGWQIGLHPSFLTWCAPEEIASQRKALEGVTSRPVEIVRQHWLRFSWAHTWGAQEKAGLSLDLTLGFNDRPGFRNSAALRMPIYSGGNKKSTLESVPMVLMDSHLYDYSNLSSEQRIECMKHYLDEIKQVGGVGSIIWHPHVFGRDYGWSKGYENLLACWCGNDATS